jgi:hypothetical protein
VPASTDCCGLSFRYNFLFDLHRNEVRNTQKSRTQGASAMKNHFSSLNRHHPLSVRLNASGKSAQISDERNVS